MSISPQTSRSTSLSRRQFVQLGALGLSLPAWLRASALSAGTTKASSGFGSAKSCIVLFAWGGMSHVDTWDMKPDMGSEIRGEFNPISTSVPGIHISEHMPGLAQRAQHLAIVRSMHHKAAAHREAAYWNLTGHAPERIGGAPVKPTRKDWPCIGGMISHAREAGLLQQSASALASPLPGSISLPYPIADAGLVNGQLGGFLGSKHDPIYIRPKSGRPYEGRSPRVGNVSLDLVSGVDRQRLASRRSLLEHLENLGADATGSNAISDEASFHTQAMDMLMESSVRGAFDIEQAPITVRDAYGDHICGQSVLLARRLTEAGVPLVTVFCSAGDLNGSVGAHWDTHGDNFNRLKRDLLPPLDMASAALLDDLSRTGRLDETLVVWLTEFGRTPRVGGNGRDHFPNCYSIALAGGGVRGGQVYGSSNRTGSEPISGAAGPEDLHATIFHALGINHESIVHDLQGRPLPLSTGTPLQVF